MGTYHTFFVANDAELDRLFPGWKRVKPEKGRRERKNPFTGQMMTTEEWVPAEEPTPLGKPSLYDDAWGPPIDPIVPPVDEYMLGIERAGAPGLRALPHFRAKNFTPFVDLAPFVEALLGAPTAVPPVRLGPTDDDDSAQVDALPEAAATKLLTIDDAALADAIQEAVDADVMLEDARDGASAFFLENALVPLKALAREASSRNARVCHLWAMHY